MNHNGSRPKCQAVEGRLERRVRPRLATVPERSGERDWYCSAGGKLDWAKLRPDVRPFRGQGRDALG